jgi:hypothetical protein
MQSICTKHELKAYEMRLEEIRARLNADFHEVMVASVPMHFAPGVGEQLWEKQTKPAN